ncbi:MAG: C1 family peptidase [Phycisphaeraceae bacterium]|nr:C1 family peptidase [Phycisphaeraceae bacterium]
MENHPTHPHAQAAGSLTTDDLHRLRTDFDAKPAYRLAQNAVTQVGIKQASLNRAVVTTTDHTFSHLLDDWKATDQKNSGRCWLFAGLNLLRVGAMKKMNLKEFEFSQNYIFFWDKLERANYFLESIIATASRPLDDRAVAFLLSRPLDDGGQWNMFVNLVHKYGLVPKSVMPETDSSSNTGPMNEMLLGQLRQAACQLRQSAQAGADLPALRQAKDSVLAVIHRILCIHLGTPPVNFDWQWMDKDRAFHRDGLLTPRQFAEKYVTLALDDYVCVVHDPRPTSPMDRTYTVEFLGNVIDGGRVLYLNVAMPLIKQIAMQTIMDGQPVWFGCDVDKMMRQDLGLWDTRAFDYAGVYDTSFTLDKAQRLLYHHSLMTHAMLFTGVDVVDHRPRRWRVENSWGKDDGRKGFFVMNDSWFDEYVFEAAVRQSALPSALQAALAQAPIVLPPWDPMGALAG